MERKPLSKRLRFEVFKRDSFKCQYCGAAAPEVLLHVDHIKAVADGGTDDITNLVTACEACNLGKSCVPLSENIALEKSRRQMEALQERREQLEMLMEWREGLRDLAEESVDRLAEYWYAMAPGFVLNETGKGKLRKWSKKFSVEDITSAMDTAASQYLEFKPDGACDGDSWNRAFDKISGICTVNRRSKENPDIKESYYIRGILRNRIPGYFDENRALLYLQPAPTSPQLALFCSARAHCTHVMISLIFASEERASRSHGAL